MRYRETLNVGDRVRNTRRGGAWREGVVRLVVPPGVCMRRLCARAGLGGVGRLRRGVLYDWETYVVEAAVGGKARLYHPPKPQIEVAR